MSSGNKMNGNQIISPEIKRPINGNNPLLGKLRRKLGWTYVLSNPFKVPVTQMPATQVASQANSSKKTKKNPFKVGTAFRAGE
jgi:hypothetical protein